MRYSRRKQSGQGLIECLAAMLCLIVPIALALLDLGFYVTAASLNRNTAKTAARAAANCKSSESADKAVGEVVTRLRGKLQEQKLLTVEQPETRFDRFKGEVVVKSTVRAIPPVPIWFLPGQGSATFVCESVEPIVALTPGAK